MTDDVTLELGGPEVRITRPDKVVLPSTGHTTLDLVEYSRAVEEPWLSGVGVHPVLLERFPDRPGGKSFFRKRLPKGTTDWLQTTVVATPNGTTSNALVVVDPAEGLVVDDVRAAAFRVCDLFGLMDTPWPPVDTKQPNEPAGRARSSAIGLMVIDRQVAGTSVKSSSSNCSA